MLPLLDRFNNRHISEEINIFNEVYSALIINKNYICRQLYCFKLVFLFSSFQEIWKRGACGDERKSMYEVYYMLLNEFDGFRWYDGCICRFI